MNKWIEVGKKVIFLIPTISTIINEYKDTDGYKERKMRRDKDKERRQRNKR